MNEHRVAGFTLSLDCEGFWGMADRAEVLADRRLNDAALRDVYSWLLLTLAHANVKATAAFVTCFAAGLDAVRANHDLLRRMAVLELSWFANLMPLLEQGGRPEGWDGAALYQAVKADGHEIAWHGTTHLSLSDRTAGEAVELELILAGRLFGGLGDVPRTIVFPRNLVGHLEMLRGAGFLTYRGSPPAGLARRMLGLLNEWNIWDSRVEAKPEMRDGWHVSPSGFFLNWPAGVRSLVPVPVTIRRWKSLLREAVDRGGYVHMWFHPHNLITAPLMKIAFDEILGEVGELVRSGDLISLTMAEANEYYRTEIGGVA